MLTKLGWGWPHPLDLGWGWPSQKDPPLFRGWGLWAIWYLSSDLWGILNAGPDHGLPRTVSGHWQWAVLAQNLKRCCTKKPFLDFSHKGVSGSQMRCWNERNGFKQTKKKQKKKKKGKNLLKTPVNSKAHESQELVGRQADANVRRCFSGSHFAKSSLLHTDLCPVICLLPAVTKPICECFISLLFLFKKTDVSF